MNLLSRAVAAFLFICPIGLFAQTANRTGSLMVVPTSHLPESAQMPAESMYLSFNGDGTAYLYVEQHAHARLVVLDVTHPAHITQVATANIQGAAFDFVRPLGPSTALICFRDNSGSGLAQFRKAKQPVIVVAPGLKQATHTEDLGPSGLLITNGQRTPSDMPEHDVQVVDLSTPAGPTVLATARLVHQQLTDTATGARFLLGSDGLTVVRQPDVEAQNEMAMKSGN